MTGGINAYNGANGPYRAPSTGGTGSASGAGSAGGVGSGGSAGSFGSTAMGSTFGSFGDWMDENSSDAEHWCGTRPLMHELADGYSYYLNTDLDSPPLRDDLDAVLGWQFDKLKDEENME